MPCMYRFRHINLSRHMYSVTYVPVYVIRVYVFACTVYVYVYMCIV